MGHGGSWQMVEIYGKTSLRQECGSVMFCEEGKVEHLPKKKKKTFSVHKQVVIGTSYSLLCQLV
jgi:hypothetical protein